MWHGVIESAEGRRKTNKSDQSTYRRKTLNKDYDTTYKKNTDCYTHDTPEGYLHRLWRYFFVVFCLSSALPKRALFWPWVVSYRYVQCIALLMSFLA
jgi:hypothetical protein